MKRQRRSYILLFTLFLLFTVSAFAHPGSLDENGGHYNRKTGEYHYHSGENTQYNPSNSSNYTYLHQDDNANVPKEKKTVEDYVASFLWIISSFALGVYLANFYYNFRYGTLHCTFALWNLGYLSHFGFTYLIFKMLVKPILVILTTVLFIISPKMIYYDYVEIIFLIVHLLAIGYIYAAIYQSPKFAYYDTTNIEKRFIHKEWWLLCEQDKEKNIDKRKCYDTTYNIILTEFPNLPKGKMKWQNFNFKRKK